MTQKVLKVGDSAGVIIPKKSLEELLIAIGDEVEVIVDKKKNRITIQPTQNLSAEDKKIALLTKNFIDQHRGVLKRLAKK